MLSLSEFAKRMENAFRFQVTMDDVNAQLGEGSSWILAFPTKEFSKKMWAEFQRGLEKAGYIFKNKNSGSGAFVWERDKEGLIIYTDPQDFNRKREEVEILSSLFKRNPEYALIGAALCQDQNVGYVRHRLLEFVKDGRFQEGNFTVPNARAASLEIIDSIESELGLEVFFDQAEYLIEGKSRYFLVKLKSQEQVNVLGDFLEQNSYRIFAVSDADKLPFRIWFNKSDDTIMGFVDELLFEKKAADSRWLTKLFLKRPDYALLGSFFLEAMGFYEIGEVFLSLGKTTEFYELSFGIGRKSFPLPDPESIRVQFMRDVMRAEEKN